MLDSSIYQSWQKESISLNVQAIMFPQTVATSALYMGGAEEACKIGKARGFQTIFCPRMGLENAFWTLLLYCQSGVAYDPQSPVVPVLHTVRSLCSRYIVYTSMLYSALPRCTSLFCSCWFIVTVAVFLSAVSTQSQIIITPTVQCFTNPLPGKIGLLGSSSWQQQHMHHLYRPDDAMGEHRLIPKGNHVQAAADLNKEFP